MSDTWFINYLPGGHIFIHIYILPNVIYLFIFAFALWPGGVWLGLPGLYLFISVLCFCLVINVLLSFIHLLYVCIIFT